LKKKFAMAIGMVCARKGEKGYPSIEYDDVDIKTVISDVKRLQKKYKLGKCVLLKTKKGFHVHFFWDNLREWDEIVEIIDDSGAPEDFKKISKEFGKRVLRVSGKYSKPDLEILGILDSPYEGVGSKEFGDLLFLMFQKLMNLELPRHLLYN